MQIYIIIISSSISRDERVFMGGHARSSLEMLEGGEEGLPVGLDADAIEFMLATLFVLPPGQSR
jgi:hypothetical protein